MTIFGPIAQLVEHLTFNQRVLGSSPSRITILDPAIRNDSGVFLYPPPPPETTMSTRRNAATALIGLPMITAAAKIIEVEPPNKSTELKQLPVRRKPATTITADLLSEKAVRIISYTLYAEARGESFLGKKAVAAVIHTRSRQLQLPMPRVCQQENQFSCWNTLADVPSSYASGAGLRQADIKARSDCYALAWLLAGGYAKWDYLTHFYNPKKASPAWRREMKGVKTIGNHVFGYIR